MWKKIHQFLSNIKQMHTKENWFLFSASQCRVRTGKALKSSADWRRQRSDKYNPRTWPAQQSRQQASSDTRAEPDLTTASQIPSFLHTVVIWQTSSSATCCRVDNTLPEHAVTGFYPGWMDLDADWLHNTSVSITLSQVVCGLVTCLVYAIQGILRREITTYRGAYPSLKRQGWSESQVFKGKVSLQARSKL